MSALFMSMAIAAGSTPLMAQPAPDADLDRQLQELKAAREDLARRFGANPKRYRTELDALLNSAPTPSGESRRGRSMPRDATMPPSGARRLEPNHPFLEDPRYTKALEAQLDAESQQLRKGRTRMIGGRPTTDKNGTDHFPHTVALRTIDGALVCSGTVVAPRAVLTAAHCLCSTNYGRGLRVGDMVVFGTTIRGSNGMAITKLTPYALGCSPDRFPGRDLALVFVDSSSFPAAPAPVGDAADFKDGSPLWVAGFGKDEHGSSGTKLAARIRVVSRRCAGPDDRRWYGCVPDRETVLSDRTGRDSCNGDSGGPAFVGGENDKPRLVAVVSRGFPGMRDCGGGGVYTLMTREATRWMVEELIRFETANPSRNRALEDPGAELVGRSPGGSGSNPPGAASSHSRCMADCAGADGSMSTSVRCTETCLCRHQCEAVADNESCAAYCSRSVIGGGHR